MLFDMKRPSPVQKYICNSCHTKLHWEESKTLIATYEEHYKCCLLPYVIIRYKDRYTRDTSIANLEPVWDMYHVERRKTCERLGLKCPKCDSRNVIRAGVYPKDSNRVNLACGDCNKTWSFSKSVVDCLVFRSKGVDDPQPLKQEETQLLAQVERANYLENVRIYVEERSLKNNKTCPTCGSKLIHKNGLENGKQLFACSDCSRSFRDDDDYIDYKVQLVNRGYICPVCSSKYIRRNGFYNGYQYYHCRDCGKSFGDKYIDYRKRGYVCPKCGDNYVVKAGKQLSHPHQLLYFTNITIN